MRYEAPWQKRLENLAENHGHCEFIGALLAPLIASVLPEAIATETILGTAVPSIIGGALGNAAIGAGISGLTGGNPLLGALGGGLSGAVGAFGPALGAATGIGEVGGDVLTGVAGGVLSSEITGSSPLTGGLIGGATGALGGILSPSATTAGATSTATTAPGGGAAATAIPSGGTAANTAAALGTGGLFDTPTTAGTSISGTPSGGTGGGSGAVSGVSAPATTGTVSGTATSAATTPATTGGGGISGLLNNLFGGGGGANLSGGGTTLTSDPSLGQGNFDVGQSTSGGPVTGAAGPGVSVTSTGEVVGSGTGGILNTIEGGIGKLISNPLALVSGGLLGYELLSGGLSNNTAADQALQQQEAAAASTATMLQAPLRSGVLPTGAQSALDLSQQNQEASARSAYASMGMGASTGQADAFQAIAQRIAAEKVGIEESLFQEAAPYAQLASSDDIAILNQQRAEDQQFTQSLMTFVAALAGGKSGTPAVA